MRRTIGFALAAALVVAACGGGDTSTETTEPADTTGTTESATTTVATDATTTQPLYGTVAPDEADEAAGAGDATITIENFSFGPAIEVSTGETVTVTNADGVPHTWTAEEGPFDSGTIGSGETFEYTFSEQGEFAFFCEIHPGMTGTITVTG